MEKEQKKLLAQSYMQKAEPGKGSSKETKQRTEFRTTTKKKPVFTSTTILLSTKCLPCLPKTGRKSLWNGNEVGTEASPVQVCKSSAKSRKYSHRSPSPWQGVQTKGERGPEVLLE